MARSREFQFDRLLWQSAGLIFAIGFFLAGGFAGWLMWGQDHSLANAVFAVTTLVACGIGYFWMLRLKSLPVLVRIAIAILPILSLAIFLSLFELDGFSGELVPQFRNRWEQEISSTNRSNAPPVISDSSQTSLKPEMTPDELDFRKSVQFWGNRGNGVYENVNLVTDWSSEKPEELWRIAVGAGWGSFAVAQGIAVTLEQAADEASETAIGLDLLTGKTLWEIKLDGSHSHPVGGAGPRTTPLIDGNRVFVCSSVGKLACIDLLSGESLWQRDLNADMGIEEVEFERSVAWGRSGSPIMAGGNLVIPLGGNDRVGVTTLAAINPSTGEYVWKSGTDQISYSTPQLLTLDGVPQIVLMSEQYVAGYSIAEGVKIWQFDWSSSSAGKATTSQVAQINATKLLLSKGYGRGCIAISIKQEQPADWKPKFEWKNERSLKTKFTSCVVRNGFAYGLSDGRLECIELERGERRWVKGRYGHGQVLLVRDTLLITSEDGDLAYVVADPKESRELAKMKVLDGLTWNIPTLAGDLLLMRNGSEAVCLKLPIVQQSVAPESR